MLWLLCGYCVATVWLLCGYCVATASAWLSVPKLYRETGFAMASAWSDVCKACVHTCIQSWPRWANTWKKINITQHRSSLDGKNIATLLIRSLASPGPPSPRQCFKNQPIPNTTTPNKRRWEVLSVLLGSFACHSQITLEETNASGKRARNAKNKLTKNALKIGTSPSPPRQC